METNPKKKPKKLTPWHKFLGTLLEYLLSPVNLSVSTNFSVMSESPKADILIIRREESQWTAEQFALLPDGIRDSQATDILIEFKYTQSFNENALQQALGYDFFYKQHQRPNAQEDVQTFLLSARKPRKETLAQLGYEKTSLQGVYRSKFGAIRKVVLLSLNELSNQPHNAFVKCFASHKKEKQKAFDTLKQKGLASLTSKLQWFIAGLKEFWFSLKGGKMRIELTPEQITDMGKMWGKGYLSCLSVDEVQDILSRLSPQDRLAGLNPQDVLSLFNPQDIFSLFKPQDRLAGLNPQDRLAGLNPQDRLAGLNPQDRLAGLNPQELDELENYLKNRPR